ncbi:MAG TPA: polymorphic toxin-type HINT domain-containing protein [Polyangiaceae bacterium]|jgi:Flp pilus assembly pilin Flp
MRTLAASLFTRLRRDTRGANLVEYVIIAGVIAIFAMTAFRTFGRTLDKKLRGQAQIIATLDGDESGGGGCIGGLCMNGNCFVAGTPVATPSGDRPIEAVREGDVVLSRDERTHQIAPRRVLRTFVTPEMPVVAVRVQERPVESIRATPGHRFWTEDRAWIAAEDLVAGEALASDDGALLHVASVAREEEAQTVFNFEVDGTHTYFVGGAHVLVHNPTPQQPGGCGGNGGGGSGDPSGGGASGGGASGGGTSSGGLASNGGPGGSTTPSGAYDPRSDPRFGSLASDPAHGGAQTPGSINEAVVGLTLEHQGAVPGPIQRATDPKSEFTDGTGQKWDVKAPRSGAFLPPGKNGQPAKGSFDLGNFEKTVAKEQKNGNNLMVDVSNMTPADAQALKGWVASQPNLNGKVLYYGNPHT